MLDDCNRVIDYLRLSVTDLCNLRCVYCMPEEGVPKLAHQQMLSIEEMEEIVRVVASLGVRKVRITGGEPLVRRGIVEICRRVARVPGISELCLTTNGVALSQFAAPLRDAGVSRLNLSLDTLRADRFEKITRVGRLMDTLNGIEAAERAGFSNIKINTVLIGGFNIDEIPDFVHMTKARKIQSRFIELMPIGACASFDQSAFVKADAVLEAVPSLLPVGQEGVARVYRLLGAEGTVGLIRPLSDHFCDQCNRIRVTADGRLKACLHSDLELSIRGLSGDRLREAIARAIAKKPQRHFLSAASPSETRRTMNQIGG